MSTADEVAQAAAGIVPLSAFERTLGPVVAELVEHALAELDFPVRARWHQQGAIQDNFLVWTFMVSRNRQITSYDESLPLPAAGVWGSIRLDRSKAFQAQQDGDRGIRPMLSHMMTEAAACVDGLRELL